MRFGIVYYSRTGNTLYMAKEIARGIRTKESKVDLYSVQDFNTTMIDQYDCIVFGCPACGKEELESEYFEPMFRNCEKHLKNRSIALFGSYGFGDGEWMNRWKERCYKCGANVKGYVVCDELADEDELKCCFEFGVSLAE